MREISQHVLDLVYNSIEAGATRVEITVVEDPVRDLLSVAVADNGRGMDKQIVDKVLDPFYTSRSTRSVGLGLSLLNEAARAADGAVEVQSQRGVGTTVTARYRYHHLDRQPLGDMASTLLVAIVGAPIVDFHYRHQVDGRIFDFDTAALRSELGDLPISHPSVVRWLREFLEEGFRNLHEAELIP